MECPRCRQGVPAGAQFCPECGAKLDAACPQCGAANAPGHKFCMKCGQPLGPAERDPARFVSPRTYTPKHLAEKILTAKTALRASASR